MRFLIGLIVTITLQLPRTVFAEVDSSVEAPQVKATEAIPSTSDTVPPAAKFEIATPQDPAQLLQTGMSWFNSKEYQKAFNTFILGVQQEPTNLSFRLNAGLAAMKLGKKGLSLAYVRSAYELDPSSRDSARILHQVTEDARIVQIPRQILFIENVTQFAHFFPLWLCVILAFAFMTGLIFRLWTWLPLWRQARLTGESTSLPAANYALFLAFLFCFGVSLLEFYDRSLTRGTVIAAKTEVKTLPEETAADLIEFYEGFEVLVKETRVVENPQTKTSTEWLKVQYPGSFQGWVKATDVQITSLTSVEKNR